MTEQTSVRFLLALKLSAVWFCPLMVGCGGHPATVEGTITLDGQRLVPEGANGGVVFRPMAGGPLANAHFSPDGTYVLNTGTQAGLPLGALSGNDFCHGSFASPLPDGTQMPGKQLSAEQYRDKDRTEFEVEVEPGSNRFDFDVERGANLQAPKDTKSGSERRPGDRKDLENESEFISCGCRLNSR